MELNEKSDDIKKWLNALVHRRNQIVHEGDLKRASRSRRLQFNDVDHTRIEEDVDWVESLIDTIDEVVTSQ